MNETEQKLSYILEQFKIKGTMVDWRLIDSGHINTTYYAKVKNESGETEYLVQMVNWYVFRQPVSMMHNIELITSHIMQKENCTERRRRLHFHHTLDGKNYFRLGEGADMEFWRVTNFIEDAISFESAAGDPLVLRMSGKAFGRFEHELCDFHAEDLVESIPHFHDTRFRLETFFHDVDADIYNRADECREEIRIIRENRKFACVLNEMVDRGELPIRVTHNDTKTNNVLFDKTTLEPLVVIDLDTVMPGLAAHDFGDTIRFAACEGTENETDLSKMKVDLGLYRAFAEGYIGETADFLTKNELKSMALGAAVITLELASRFLDDYLTGDKYFRIDYPTHNLVRARSQLALFQDMMLHLDEMDRIVHEIAGR